MRRTLTTVAAIALALILAAPAAQAVLAPKEQKESLLYLLQAHEFHVDKKMLDRIGPDVDRILVHIAEDPKMRPTVRARAVAALGVYPTQRTYDFLSGLLYEPALIGTPGGTNIRRQALRSLGWGFGDKAVNTVAALKEDTDAQIREACAHALGDTRSPHAVGILDAWLPNEPELFVRLAVDRSLDRLRGTGR